MLATLDSPLPASLPVGKGTALFCWGRCSSKPAIVVDGVFHCPSAAGMRDGVYWGVVPVPPRAAGTLEIALAASGAIAPVGKIEVVEPARPPSLGRAAPGLIAVCMATYQPDLRLLRIQLDSLRAQTDTNWVCVISDDASDAPIDTGGDERFTVVRAETRRGFYGNFARALSLAPAEAELIALCDQDDRWHPDKLATLRSAMSPGATMAYSDQRLVDASGRVLRDTMWEGRANNYADIVSLLVANSVTGAATLMRRDVADLALPFPDSPGMQFHDHWLALVALAAGDVAYVDRPLYDYVQHEKAVFGDVTQTDQRARRRFLRGGRGAYFLGYAGRAVQAQTLLARCRPAPPKRRSLERYLAAERSPAAFAWLGLHALKHRRETLGSELELMRGIAWRHARPRDVTIPDPLAFEQRRLRSWRARI